MSFGIFYTCFTETEAVDFSIETLKQHYPDCPVYLVSDGGSDFSFLEQKYRNVKVQTKHDSRGISQNFTFEKWKDPNNREKVYESIIEFFDRNMEAIQYCKTDSILIMEPDVLVRGKLKNLPSDKNSLLGSRINEVPNVLKEIARKINPSVNCTHYGSTPAFYYTNSFLRVNEFIRNNKNLVMEFINADPAFVCYDVFLTCLFACCGYDEVLNDDLVECMRSSKWKNSHHPLLHQYRFKYPTENYTGRHSNGL